MYSKVIQLYIRLYIFFFMYTFNVKTLKTHLQKNFYKHVKLRTSPSLRYKAEQIIFRVRTQPTPHICFIFHY